MSGIEHIPVQAKTRGLAERLLVLETARGVLTPGDEISFRACDRLRQLLSALAGTGGFHTLLFRALILAKMEFPRLVGATLSTSGCLINLSSVDPPLHAEEAIKGEAILIGHIVELLCIFLGETVTLRLIQDGWPDASFIEYESELEGKA